MTTRQQFTCLNFSKTHYSCIQIIFKKLTQKTSPTRLSLIKIFFNLKNMWKRNHRKNSEKNSLIKDVEGQGQKK